MDVSHSMAGQQVSRVEERCHETGQMRNGTIDFSSANTGEATNDRKKSWKYLYGG